MWKAGSYSPTISGGSDFAHKGTCDTRGAYRTIESLRWKGPIRPLIHCYAQESKSKDICQFLLNASSVGVLTICQGNWFHCCTALMVRTSFLIFSWNPASCNFIPLLCVLRPGTAEKSSCLSFQVKHYQSSLLKAKHAQFFQMYVCLFIYLFYLYPAYLVG